MVFENKKVVLCHGVADLRKGAAGLLSFLEIAEEGVWYLFSNRTRSLVKAVCLDRQGTWLLTRRLKQGVFDWPERAVGASELDPASAESVCLGERQKRLAEAFI